MKRRVEYTANAERELVESYEWIREKSPLSARLWMEKRIGAVESLADATLSHPPAPEALRLGRDIRLMLVGKRRSQYRVHHLIEATRVIVLSIRSSFRKPLEADDLAE